MDESLKSLAWLLGAWEGTAAGQPGEGTQIRRYESVLRGRFIMGTNRTIWSSTAGHPEGEVHEDLSIISYDAAAKRPVMHVFYVERFVAEYQCDPQTDPDTWIFTAERVQNGPQRMRAREILTRNGDLLESRFELATGGKDFAPYTQETLQRQRPL